MNIILDSTLGLLFIYAMIVAFNRLVAHYDWDLLAFGDYGKPPRVSVRHNFITVVTYLTW